MKAEFTGFRDSQGNHMIPPSVTIEDWENQTFLSSGSLIAKSCKSALMLARHNEDIQESASEFGKYISFAHQVSYDHFGTVE